MKKITTLFAVLLVALFVCSPIQVFAEEAINNLPYRSGNAEISPVAYYEMYDYTTIQTPTGRNVSVGVLNYADLNEIQMAESYATNYSVYGDSIFLISNATYKYNCHSYAWYSQEYLSNPYWMPDPTPYFDCSLEEHNSYEESEGLIGDIIVYFNSSNQAIHSGVVVSVLDGESNGICGNADLRMVQSKWGRSWFIYSQG